MIGFHTTSPALFVLSVLLAIQGSFVALHAPAGFAIDALTPEQIALSILAEITALRRRRQRVQPPGLPIA